MYGLLRNQSLISHLSFSIFSSFCFIFSPIIKLLAMLLTSAILLLSPAALYLINVAEAHPNCLADVILAHGLERRSLVRRADWSYEGTYHSNNESNFSLLRLIISSFDHFYHLII
jgi:hypothetical protein